MTDKQAVIEQIKTAFGNNVHPGAPFLQGSFEGCEPYEETSPFADKDWNGLEPGFLDGHYSALSFFSEAGFRYFLPAYMIADLNDQLETADPVFHLTHGFYEFSFDYRTDTDSVTVTRGKSSFINPRRYGAATSYDYARYKLSIFTREEAEAIVAYLRVKQEAADLDETREQIQAALDLYWLERARGAPPAAALEAHLRQEEKIQAVIRQKSSG